MAYHLVGDLVLPYADFKLSETIDPEQFDLNNAVTVAKINEMASLINTDLPKFNIKNYKILDKTGTVISTQLFDDVKNFFGFREGNNIQLTNDPVNSVITINSTFVLDPNSITTAMLQSGCVTGFKVANLSIGTNHLVDLSVTNAKIATGAVTSDKIASGAVTADKLDSALTTTVELNSHILKTTLDHPDQSVTRAKIKDGAVGKAQVDITQIPVLGVLSDEINLFKALNFDVSILAIEVLSRDPIYNKITQIRQHRLGVTVRLTTFTRGTDGKVDTITDVAGGKTVIYNIVRDSFRKFSSMNRSVI